MDKKYKILFTRKLLDKDIDYIKSKLFDNNVDCYDFVIPNEFSENTISKLAYDADILFGPLITEKILLNAKKLKYIQVPWTGVDNLNYDAIKNENPKLKICNSHSNSVAVAEHSIALALDLIKKITYHNNLLKHDDWNRSIEHGLSIQSKLICKMNVAVFGFGNIGKKIAEIMKIFGANVSAVDNYINKSSYDGNLYNTSELGLFLSNQDLLFVCLPLTNETKNLINDEFLSLTKDVYIINTSRAEIIDESSIYNALKIGAVKGFASDVWWNSPKRGESYSKVSLNHDFKVFNNVIFSPHRAAFIEESLPHLDDAILNLIYFSKGEQLINVIDIEKKF